MVKANSEAIYVTQNLIKCWLGCSVSSACQLLVTSGMVTEVASSGTWTWFAIPIMCFVQLAAICQRAERMTETGVYQLSSRL